MKNACKFLAALLSISLLSMSFNSARAAMIANDVLVSGLQQQDAKAELLQTINRTEVTEQLLSMGVSPEYIEQRIRSMTHEELAQLNQQIEELPAGGTNILGVLLVIFIVFVITDAIGATDIFPFIHPVN